MDESRVLVGAKRGGWLLDARSQPNTKLIAAQLRTFYAISLAIGQLPTYQCFEGRLEFFTASVPTANDLLLHPWHDLTITLYTISIK